MRAIEIARRLVELGQTEDACRAYTLSLQEAGEPVERMEAAAFILQSGGDYRISYGCFRELYNQGHFQEDILPLMEAVFYEPNVRLLKSRYERNCKLLGKYPYLFRRDFVPFEELPVQFFPYDDHNGYIPFYRAEKRFGEFVNFGNQVVSRNFFRDLEKPILARDVFSQYELEYLNDNVRKSEHIGRENHVYLYYTDWGVFCSYLQCLNLRKVLEEKKLVFLIEDEAEQYPIDFKERFGIDYSQYPVRPVGIREVNRLIWHTQLSTHNGGDFFNEVFDAHPNLICLPSVMMDSITDVLEKVRAVLKSAKNARQAAEELDWSVGLTEELYHMQSRTDKDILAAVYLGRQDAVCGLDMGSRIVPAMFFQPHFENIEYRLRVDGENRTVLESESYEQVRTSPIFQNFKYIKTFTPLRRFTTSHSATVRFMYIMSQVYEEQYGDDRVAVVSDVAMERVLNRSFMIDPEDRLYRDSVLVRFEDAKLNPKAVFTALAAFLDLPYTESMTRCTEGGRQAHMEGFDTAPVYRTYDEYANEDERCFIEYFLRDAYEYYGYDFQYYDGTPVDEARAKEWVKGFTTVDHYMRETWTKYFHKAIVSYLDGERVDEKLEEKVQLGLLEDSMKQYAQNRLDNVEILLEGLRFVNKRGQPLRMMPQLELDPALLEQPLYH